MSLYLIDALPAKRSYSWFLTCDPNKRHGALLSAIDEESNRFYCAEHYAEAIPDSQHAKAYRALCEAFGLNISRDVEVWADPGGAGAQAIINLAELGIGAAPVPKGAGSVKASIELIRRAAWVDPGHRHPISGALGAPHCYFLSSLRSEWTQDGTRYAESRLLWELRQYRQEPNGPPDTPIKTADDVADCMRYLELVRPFAPKHVDRAHMERLAELDVDSRSAQNEFDEIVRKASQPQRSRTRMQEFDV